MFISDFFSKRDTICDLLYSQQKLIKAFALQKLFTFFQQKYWHISDIKIWNFKETLTNYVISFEQPGAQ